MKLPGSNPKSSKFVGALKPSRPPREGAAITEPIAAAKPIGVGILKAAVPIVAIGGAQSEAIAQVQIIFRNEAGGRE